ncbi:MAG TPA: carboxypeptidase regulatory-like domain-containing protein [Terriglobales bacterium]|jgi:hypothetical protein|nr:carboxypeptidase regulatory-like domain-containing protein [Terriglobales bacterium]
MEPKKYGSVILAVLVLAMLAPVPAIAQVLKGSISGSVTDSQGTIISGAEVKATQAETGAVFITESNSDGVFRFNLLPTGHYTVKISKQGFQGHETQGVIVAAGIDSSLGAVKVPISGDTVPTEAPATATALQGTQTQVASLSSDTVLANFPGIEENEGLDRLALFVPGAVNTRSNNFSNVNGAPFSINGLRGRNNDEQIDGQYNNDNTVAGPNVFLADPNFVQQYVLVSNNFAPEYGRNSGSVVNIITRSGTDAWHGNIYGTLTNTSLSAFSNLQKFNLATKDQSPINRNDEFSGFTIGGPVLKNKLFIFGGFDNEIINTSTLFTTSSLTPTPLGLTQLAGCGSSLNANALTFLNQFGPYAFKAGDPTPLPNPVTGLFSNINVGPCTNVQFGGVERTLPTPTHGYNGVIRADLQLGNDIITSRYIFNRSLFFNGNDNPVAGWAANTHSLGQEALLSWSHNLSAHMVNEARVSFGRLNVDFGGNSIGNPLEPGSKNVFDAFPNVSFSGGGVSIGPATNFPQGRMQNTWQAQDNWNYVLGRHQFKAGINYTYQKSPIIVPVAVNGQFRFNSVSSFLLNNQPNRVEISRGNPESDFREHNTFLYFGDDWKISQNLTLNLGLTWSYFSQPANSLHDATSSREDSPSTALWDTTLPLSVRTTPSVSSVGTNFGPSIGFAYSPQWGGFLTGNGKTVFRGGYRLLYDPAFYNIYTNIATSAPNTYLPVLTGPAATPFSLPATPTGDGVRAQLSPLFTVPTDPRLFPQDSIPSNLKADRVHTWTFGFERELTKNSVFEARYVGNHATHLFQSLNGNPFIADLKTDFPTLVPDNLTPCTAAQAFNPVAIGRVNCNEGIVNSRGNTGYSYYNGLQLEFRANNLFKQLTMRTGYTWSKTLDNTSEVFSTDAAGNTVAFSQNPIWARGAEYSVSAFDTPNVFTLLFTEQLPFFREQHGASGHLLGGWAISGNYIAASGQPYTPLQGFTEAERSATGNFYDSAFTNAFFGADVARPFYGNRHAPADSVGIFAADFCKTIFGITPSNSAFNPGACNTTITNPNQLLSMNSLNAGGQFRGPGTTFGSTQAPVSATADQVRFIINGGTAQQTFGTPFGNVPRGALRDAPQNIFNLTISKDTRITERVSLRIHLTALNAFNHFNFANVDSFLENAGLNPLPNSATNGLFGTGFGQPQFTNANGRTVYVGAKLNF